MSNDSRQQQSSSSLTDLGDPDAPPRLPFPIVAVGASAGGLPALEHLFKAMPKDTGAAFVVITHLDPSRESHLTEILGKHATLPVQQIRDNQKVEPNQIYVIPPNTLLGIRKGSLKLEKAIERPAIPKPIDRFMRDLAKDQKDASIAIILSGTDADGSIGLKEIKAEGGMVMVQQPSDAEYRDMPRNAIHTGLADFVVPVEEMADALMGYLHNADLRGDIVRRGEVAQSAELDEILTVLKEGGWPDFRGYKKGMIGRRIKRRMGVTRTGSLRDYQAQLEKSDDEREALAQDLLIGVTEFFREPENWNLLATSVLPDLFRANAGKVIRAWVPACATGEEVYSLAMLLLECAPNAEALANIQIFGTDINSRALATARAGEYSGSAVNALSPERLQRFFVRVGDLYRVSKELREMVLFAPQNLLVDPPFSRLDLITCRNFLIYLDPPVQEELARLLAFALNPGGTLMLGSSETLIDSRASFEVVDKKARLFRLKSDIGQRPVDFTLRRDAGWESRTLDGASSRRATKTYEKLVQKMVLDRFTPTAVLVNGAYQVLYSHGQTDDFLQRVPGEPTDNLLQIARGGLQLKLRAAFHQAVHENRTISVDGYLQPETREGPVRASIMPVPGATAPREVYLVVFEHLPEAVTPVPRIEGSNELSAVVGQLQDELVRTRRELQDSIHDLESANEELKVSNEETMSMNEELQSSNEELSTSKEEIQSVNEELTTVNTQLEFKIHELETTNNDLHNLLRSTNIACLFLDRSLRIRRFTQPLTRLFKLISSDTGRPITDIADPFVEYDLAGAAGKVLEDLKPIETEVLALDGRWFWHSIQPYETDRNNIEGVVVSFTDISAMKSASEDMRRLATVVRDSNDAITVHDFEGRLISWNRGAEQMYGYSEVEAKALNVMALIPEARKQEYAVLMRRGADGEPIASFETQRYTRDGRTIDVSLTASVLRDERNVPYAVGTTERDITERLRTEHQLRARATRLQETDQRRVEFLAMLAHELRNPMAPVRNALHLIRNPNISPQQLSWATDLMERQTLHMTRLIDDLLDVSRITSGKIRLQLHQVDLRTVVRDAVESTRPMLESRGHQLSETVPDEAISVWGDSVRLQQVVGNLLTNAYKYTEPRGKISIEVETTNSNDALIRVRDSGQGIAPELLPHIFELFVQGDRTMDRSQGGLGVGLTLVHRLVEAHRGHVDVRSAGPGLGSEFVVRLPLINSIEGIPQERTQAPDEAFVRRRILVVDDNEDMTDSVKLLLEMHHHEVQIAHDGVTAIEIAEGFSPEVVLLDLGLPQMNGYETAQRLRALAQTRRAVIIALSGYGQEEDKKRSMDAGFDEHLVKPAAPEKILQAVQRNSSSDPTST